MKFLVLVFFMSVCSVATAQRSICHQGTIVVRNADDMEYLQSQRCVNGSVVIKGLLMVGDEVFETLNLGRLWYITGILYVHANTRLKFLEGDRFRPRIVKTSIDDPGVVVPPAVEMIITGHGMLTWCTVKQFSIDTGMEDHVDWAENSQACEWED